uniref:Uncharacterized protein n=1 Tax=Physcomitrium patens TaxID=3218 RepID=A0A7I3ZQS6_PHYPA
MLTREFMNRLDQAATWIARLRGAYEKHKAGSPYYRLGLWRRPFVEPEKAKVVSTMFHLPCLYIYIYI